MDGSVEEESLSGDESSTLILFSGLAADANVFLPQKLALPQLTVPEWPIPQPDDTLDSYCDRLADELRMDERLIIGGASFGGIIALHVAKRLDPAAVLLIGSIRSPAELPGFARLARPLKPLVPFLPVRLLQLSCAPMTWTWFRRFAPHLSGLASQFRGSDPRVLKWSLMRILDWKTRPDPGCPVFHIHGQRDFVLPIRHTEPDTVVAGGGHLISLTHGEQVNAFIRSAIQQATGYGEQA